MRWHKGKQEKPQAKQCNIQLHHNGNFACSIMHKDAGSRTRERLPLFASCPLCGMSVADAYDLQAHVRKVHNNVEAELLQCSQADSQQAQDIKLDVRAQADDIVCLGCDTIADAPHDKEFCFVARDEGKYSKRLAACKQHRQHPRAMTAARRKPLHLQHERSTKQQGQLHASANSDAVQPSGCGNAVNAAHASSSAAQLDSTATCKRTQLRDRVAPSGGTGSAAPSCSASDLSRAPAVDTAAGIANLQKSLLVGHLSPLGANKLVTSTLNGEAVERCGSGAASPKHRVAGQGRRGHDCDAAMCAPAKRSLTPASPVPAAGPHAPVLAAGEHKDAAGHTAAPEGTAAPRADGATPSACLDQLSARTASVEAGGAAHEATAAATDLGNNLDTGGAVNDRGGMRNSAGAGGDVTQPFMQPEHNSRADAGADVRGQRSIGAEVPGRHSGALRRSSDRHQRHVSAERKRYSPQGVKRTVWLDMDTSPAVIAALEGVGPDAAITDRQQGSDDPARTSHRTRTRRSAAMLHDAAACADEGAHAAHGPDEGMPCSGSGQRAARHALTAALYGGAAAAQQALEGAPADALPHFAHLMSNLDSRPGSAELRLQSARAPQAQRHDEDAAAALCTLRSVQDRNTSSRPMGSAHVRDALQADRQSKSMHIRRRADDRGALHGAARAANGSAQAAAAATGARESDHAAEARTGAIVIHDSSDEDGAAPVQRPAPANHPAQASMQRTHGTDTAAHGSTGHFADAVPPMPSAPPDTMLAVAAAAQLLAQHQGWTLEHSLEHIKECFARRARGEPPPATPASAQHIVCNALQQEFGSAQPSASGSKSAQAAPHRTERPAPTFPERQTSGPAHNTAAAVRRQPRPATVAERQSAPVAEQAAHDAFPAEAVEAILRSFRQPGSSLQEHIRAPAHLGAVLDAAYRSVRRTSGHHNVIAELHLMHMRLAWPQVQHSERLRARIGTRQPAPPVQEAALRPTLLLAMNVLLADMQGDEGDERGGSALAAAEHAAASSAALRMFPYAAVQDVALAVPNLKRDDSTMRCAKDSLIELFHAVQRFAHQGDWEAGAQQARRMQLQLRQSSGAVRALAVDPTSNQVLWDMSHSLAFAWDVLLTVLQKAREPSTAPAQKQRSAAAQDRGQAVQTAPAQPQQSRARKSPTEQALRHAVDAPPGQTADCMAEWASSVLAEASPADTPAHPHALRKRPRSAGHNGSNLEQAVRSSDQMRNAQVFSKHARAGSGGGERVLAPMIAPGAVSALGTPIDTLEELLAGSPGSGGPSGHKASPGGRRPASAGALRSSLPTAPLSSQGAAHAQRAARLRRYTWRLRRGKFDLGPPPENGTFAEQLETALARLLQGKQPSSRVALQQLIAPAQAWASAATCQHTLLGAHAAPLSHLHICTLDALQQASLMRGIGLSVRCGSQSLVLRTVLNTISLNSERLQAQWLEVCIQPMSGASRPGAWRLPASALHGTALKTKRVYTLLLQLMVPPHHTRIAQRTCFAQLLPHMRLPHSQGWQVQACQRALLLAVQRSLHRHVCMALHRAAGFTRVVLQ